VSASTRTLLLYLAVGAVYTTLGVLVPDLIYASIEGLVFVLLGVWIVPSLIGRLARRLGGSR
jgi:hypothetical protein